jgi:PPOX class probable F420-dependent enzyme
MERRHKVTKTGDKERSGYFAALSASEYMLLTTFRRDGRAVATPVHIVAEADRAYFRTWDVSGKAKRLRHTPAVEVAPCSSRGRSRGPAVRARAVLLDGEASEQAAGALAHKHPILHGWLIPLYHRQRRWATQQYRLDPP